MRARFVIEKFRRRDGNALEILRFEMLKEQDELLRLSIRQRPNKQGVHQTQDGCGGADRQSKRQHRDKCESRLLEQLSESKLKIFNHEFITVRAAPELDRCVLRATPAKNMQSTTQS